MLITMKTTSQILDFVGVEAASSALGVTLDRVQRARRDSKLPAAWLDTLERLAGEPLPRNLFAFKSVDAA